MATTDQQQWEEETKQAAFEFGGLFTRLRDGDTFFFLFVLLLANFTVAVTANDSLSGRISAGALSGAAPLVAFLAAKAPRRWIIIAAATLVATIILSSFGEWIDNAFAVGAVNFVHMLLLFWSVPIVLRRLFVHEQVTFETVAGSLCVYLLIGLAFANLYLTLSGGGAEPCIGATYQEDVPITRGDFYYYSFIGMLTVGFGDFVPLTEWAKALTALQAILGQVVLLTLVARMVSAAKPGEKWIKRMERRVRSDDEGPKGSSLGDGTAEDAGPGDGTAEGAGPGDSTADGAARDGAARDGAGRDRGGRDGARPDEGSDDSGGS